MHNQSSNVQEFSVSDIAGAIKQLVEDRFPFIRVRGEISGLKRAASGHIYFSLKDEKSIIDSVCWKGVATTLTYAPEEGLEMIATGKITTFGSRSKYQLVVNSLEPAGEGALMALLEKRKKQLAAEGLFDEARKQLLPAMPMRIGVVTSPTGAVIQDILHRIAERFPVEVLVWPVLVQGEMAAAQIAHALEQFPTLPEHQRPDVIIVARGGGSLEDLWPFNEEAVVRAVANCPLPTISAVGHETDTTLCDYAADRRAPTPTAAAEMAVPVRAQLQEQLQQMGAQMNNRMQQQLEQRRWQCQSNIVPSPVAILDDARHRMVRQSEKLRHEVQAMLHRHREQLHQLPVPTPQEWINQQRRTLDQHASRLQRALPKLMQPHQRRLDQLSGRLHPQNLLSQTQQQHANLQRLAEKCEHSITQFLDGVSRPLERYRDALTHLDVQQILRRGFAIVRGDEGQVLSSATLAIQNDKLKLTFHDGEITSFTQSPTRQQKRKPKPIQTDLIDFLNQ